MTQLETLPRLPALEEEGDEVAYLHERTHRGAWPARFRGRYRATGPGQRAQPGTLEHFLAERYCLYALRRGRLTRAEVAHPPWTLYSAELELEHNTMADQLHLKPLGEPPLVHVADTARTLAWWPRTLS